MKFILDKEWLYKNLQDSSVRIVDCRFSLADPEKGRTEYLAGHLPGAVYFDLEKDLSSPARDHGGRHPLPELAELVDKLETAGIDNEKVIVVYDNGEGAFAGRFWWLLHYLGHEQVYVLDGGFKQWVEANYPTTVVLPSFEKEKFNIQLKPEIMADIEEVKEAALGKNENVVIIDSREEKRYLGIEEPIDKKAGHIPGAINKPWMAGLNNGSFKREEEQKERFSDVGEDKKIIVYCGSGVTATPNFLALREAGYNNVKLYVGSFSDWISYKENKIE
ncbi:sulfurtransferase [Paenibacillus sp. BSR1-1]|uniref:sulfurtransferase n=1 Tax=Paenibacillus sp. BSR1-1 TaxID=3020845 RepID=UPI0025B0405F|nr:sulfurtransferase [Paenibacillus sp. BSR1-1]MDN3016767.1 sulfurtransferase [Paenibacillus sp. BSR1-1]